MPSILDILKNAFNKQKNKPCADASTKEKDGIITPDRMFGFLGNIGQALDWSKGDVGLLKALGIALNLGGYFGLSGGAIGGRLGFLEGGQFGAKIGFRIGLAFGIEGIMPGVVAGYVIGSVTGATLGGFGGSKLLEPIDRIFFPHSGRAE
jgi:hypothetical protein